MKKVLIFATHPIQYQVPVYRELHKHFNLKVIYMHRQTKDGQAKSGFGVKFEWDIPLTDGYEYKYLKNLSSSPSSSTYNGIILDPTELASLFAEEKPDVAIIHGWFPKAMKQVINYCYRNKIKSICRGDSTLIMTNNFIKKVGKEIYIRSILRKINAFLYVGEENKKYYKHYGVSENRLFPGLHCINTPFYENEFSKVEGKKREEFIHLGFAGKFIEVKLPLLLLRAVSKSKYKSKIIVRLIGDGPLKNDIVDFCKKHHINYELLGFLNQSEIVKKGYSKIDFLVLSSRSETWGLVVNEVMTGGIPVITSDTVGCHTDLVKDGKNGYVFKSKNADDLTKKIDQLIELRSFKDNTIKNDVYSTIERFSLKNTVKDYIKCINSVTVNS